MSSSATKTHFEVQRELVLSDVGASLENVLQNLNKLNRSLEGVIAVGNEFSQVEGLWSQFENVMASAPTKDAEKDTEPGKDARDGERERERRT